MKIALLEPYNTDSHQKWTKGLLEHGLDEIMVFQLPGSHWKWRMHGAAITLYKRLSASGFVPDIVLTSDMLDLALLRSLFHRDGKDAIFIHYFHENQLTYPWHDNDPDIRLKRDRHYSFINYSSALVADHVVFNSNYHKDAFNSTIESFLNAFPDHQNTETAENISSKSSVICPGIDFNVLDAFREETANNTPLLLWNHRWEYDKNPNDFFQALEIISAEGISFQLAVCGRDFPDSPKIFSQAKEKLKSHIVHWGFCSTEEEYIRLLWKADILPVTSMQDFFGYSVVEAMYCGAYPLLPERLVFPEHVEDKKHFYNHQDEFLQKLRNVLKEPICNFEQKEFLRKRYSVSKTTEDFSQLFRKFV